MVDNNKIFERVGDVVYERNIGESLRTLTETSKHQSLSTIDRVKEDKLWGEIRRAAKTNNALQSALEECIIIYKLSKEYKDGI